MCTLHRENDRDEHGFLKAFIKTWCSHVSSESPGQGLCQHQLLPQSRALQSLHQHPKEPVCIVQPCCTCLPGMGLGTGLASDPGIKEGDTPAVASQFSCLPRLGCTNGCSTNLSRWTNLIKLMAGNQELQAECAFSFEIFHHTLSFPHPLSLKLSAP